MVPGTDKWQYVKVSTSSTDMRDATADVACNSPSLATPSVTSETP